MLKIKKVTKFSTKAGVLLLTASILFSNVNNVEAREQESEIKETIETMVTDSTFSELTQDIIRNIVDNTDSEKVLDRIQRSLKCCDNDCLSNAIFIAAYEQEEEHFKDAYQKAKNDPYLFMEYNIDEISIIDNLDGKIEGLPKQICLLTKSAEYGEYLMYKVHNDSEFYVVANKDGLVVLSTSNGCYSYTDISKKDISLISFKQYLEDNSMSDLIKEKYSYTELFENLTFDISKRLCNSKNEKINNVQDVLVVDNTDGMCLSENNNQMYYLIVKVCPYLFMETRGDIYRDVINEDARITVDSKHTICYVDYVKDVYFYNEDLYYIDGASSTDCLVDFKEFMKMKRFYTAKNVSEDFLISLNKLFMDKNGIILPEIDYDGVSIVEALKQNGYNSSKDYRAVLAVLLDMKDFNYTAEENIEMLRRLKNR